MEPSVSAETARIELARFFAVARDNKHALEMFSPYIDGIWHQMLEQPERYEEFCRSACGAQVSHSAGGGSGEIRWVESYRKMFGPLPAVWFADAQGAIDLDLRRAYENAGRVWASWDCVPAMVGNARPRPARGPLDDKTSEKSDEPARDKQGDGDDTAKQPDK